MVPGVELRHHQLLQPGHRLAGDRHPERLLPRLPAVGIGGVGIGLRVAAEAALKTVALAVDVGPPVRRHIDPVDLPHALVGVWVPVLGPQGRAAVDGAADGLVIAVLAVFDVRPLLAGGHVGDNLGNRPVASLLVEDKEAEPALQAGEDIVTPLLPGEEHQVWEGVGPVLPQVHGRGAVLLQEGVVTAPEGVDPAGVLPCLPHHVEPGEAVLRPLGLRPRQGAPRQNQTQCCEYQCANFFHPRPPVSRQSAGCPPRRSPGNSISC